VQGHHSLVGIALIVLSSIGAIRLPDWLPFGSTLSAGNGSVSAHSGGTDEYGCHGGSRPYHCHGPSLEFVELMKLNGLNERGGFKVVLKRHNDCASLNAIYLRGVANSKKGAARATGKLDSFFQLVSPALYKLNRHLDTNGNGVACGFLETENSRTLTYLCGMNSESPSPTLAKDDSYSRCVSESTALGGWKIEVISTTPDATTAMLANFAKTRQPIDGHQYFIATLRITNLGPNTASFDTSRLGIQAASRRQYFHFKDACDGLVPNSYSSYPPQTPGESRIGNLCWQVKSSDIDGLVLFHQRLLSCNCNMYSTYWAYTYISLT